MARLDGKKNSPVPLLIGLAVLALLLVGGYFLLKNRGADSVTIRPGDVSVVDNKPGNMMSNGVDAERNGNSVTIGSESANETTAPNTATAPPVTVSSGNEGQGSEKPVATDNAVTDGGATANTGSEKTDGKKDVVRERSKTIKNNKTGTTVTYSKKVHSDGSVNHEKVVSPTTGH